MNDRIREARKNESGFTLIELLIVIVILGVLAGIVVFAVSGINDNSKASACKSDLKNVEIATEAYYAQNKAYPTGGDSDARIKVLTDANILRKAPDKTNYVITLATGGKVTADKC
jgi:type II secretion system protein G